FLIFLYFCKNQKCPKFAFFEKIVKISKIKRFIFSCFFQKKNKILTIFDFLQNLKIQNYKKSIFFNFVKIQK
ncbi:MAG: hypothetical protein VX034_15985, partial [Planctomycetota bacterium]|nr:hypothetical protein [Planctomycetota bacterium]